ncbi:HAD family hydrolase [Paraburkholderia saeva]|uniref:phosphoglycolate phosphatase n=1 Tax=Paraburkholderia saeva TaxID=2777537 RepID=A0A9N8S055_9BURK|nr:HAD hydrolase-like protein [Paraburkholderia saeva]CAG4889505.1 Phosphoglycolate phosphatase [Paraburkholderia saeva]CAG4904524.1 Phosphoglycolate phosphatase [Paraburkholderia saeva]CAG4915521.1 Phosphoglycolate phosphatase [Paraburkholderia saeva]
MKTDLAIFDFDLTLVDSSRGVIECTQHALRCMQIEDVEESGIVRTIGLPLREMFAALVKVDSQTVADEFAKRFVARAEEVRVAMTTVYEQVPGLFSCLREYGVAIAIVSNKYRRRIESILECAGLLAQTDLIIGCEDVKRPKPCPDGLVKALRVLSFLRPIFRTKPQR